MSSDLINKYVKVYADGDKDVKPDPAGGIMLLGYSARKVYATTPTHRSDELPYVYAVLRGKATYFYLTSDSVAYTDSVLRIYIVEWNCIAIKCLKHLLREHYENAEDAAHRILYARVFNPPKRPDVEFKQMKKYFSRIYRDHTYMWFNGPIEEEIVAPPFVRVEVDERDDTDDVRFYFSCRGVDIYIYHGCIAININGDRAVILQDYILFHWGHVRISRKSLGFLADFGLPINASCFYSAREELLKLAAVNVLNVLPGPISEEIYPLMETKYDYERAEFVYE